MIITATELKTNIGKYLALADKEDVIITKNGKNMAKLTNARNGSAIHSLRGVLKGTDTTLDSIREERLAKYE